MFTPHLQRAHVHCEGIAPRIAQRHTRQRRCRYSCFIPMHAFGRPDGAPMDCGIHQCVAAEPYLACLLAVRTVVVEQVKPPILSAFGDIALAVGYARNV